MFGQWCFTIKSYSDTIISLQNDENRTEDGIQIEAFSLDREKEEGYFDADGNFVEYVREKEVKVPYTHLSL